MKTDVITVSSTGDQIDAVLEQTEKAAAYNNLSQKDALHLRLLAEEMMNMMRAITGEVDGTFWIESERDTFRLHLRVQTNVDYYRREKLLSASTSGKNEANRGLMGKIRSFFEPTEGAPVFFDVTPGINADVSWTLRAYQEHLLHEVKQARKDAAEAWDELEKSVVSHIADDVKVSIRDRDVEMIIYKKMAGSH